MKHRILSNKKILFNQGFLFYVFSTILITVQLFIYIFYSNQLQNMDITGWIFYVCSCISHASLLAFIPFAIFCLLVYLGFKKTACTLQIVGIVLLSFCNYINIQFFALYRFHINRFILKTVFGKGASGIFTFDSSIYIKEIFAFIIFIIISLGLYSLSKFLYKRWNRSFALWIGSFFIVCTLFSHLYHIYASFYYQFSIIKCSKIIPLYYPTTGKHLMLKIGFKEPSSFNNLTLSEGSGNVQYPLHPLEVCTKDSYPNIVFILIDSWNKRTLTQECMPNTYRFAQENLYFDNHLSSGNFTKESVFGLFFGLSGYYWETFEAGRIRPLIFKQLLKDGYNVNIHSSADLMHPIYAPFQYVIFGDIPNVRIITPGETAYAKDLQITSDFLNGLDKLSNSEKPFFSFLFFDLPHSFYLTEKQNKPFEPAWQCADYTKLNNDLDPTEFFNLYRNCCHHTDRFVGNILSALKEKGLMDNTIVILTGDHSQEFNENHHNYWGHGSNYSKSQICVPLIYHYPGQGKPKCYSHRTTHYDIVPTLMHDYLGVMNPLGDYSMGHLLLDNQPRTWHAVGKNVDYAFIVENDTIVENKRQGFLEVTDGHMNPVDNYTVNEKQFNDAMKRLHHFYK